MQQQSPKLSFSASTVKSWFQYRCDRKTRYETMLPQDRDAVPILKITSPALWAELGNQFEEQVVSKLADSVPVLCPAIGEDFLSEEQTVAFLQDAGKKKFEFAYHLVLRESNVLRQLLSLPQNVGIRWNVPDLVRCIRSGRVPVFQVIDIKATQVAALFHKAQVAFYALVLRCFLAEIGSPGLVAEEGEIWHFQDGGTSGSYEVESFALRSYEHLVIDFFKNRVPLIASQEVLRGKDSTFFHVYFKCEQCEYLAHCRKSIAPDIPPVQRDLSAVSGVSHESKRALQRMSIRTVGDLAKAQGLKSAKNMHSWALRVRGEQLAARAEALVQGKVSRLKERFTYLMPPRADTAFFLCIDVDPVDGKLATIGLLRTTSKGEEEFTIEVLTSNRREEERHALQHVLGKLLTRLSEIDQHNGSAPAEQKIFAHIFLFESSEATSLQEAIARHLDDDAIRGGLLEMIRIFPPDDAIPEPEYKGIHHLPATSLRAVLEQLYAIPTTVSYDLRQVTQALAATQPPLQYAYNPDPEFRRDFSSRLSIDVCRRLRAGSIHPKLVHGDVASRLRATAALTKWLFEENNRASAPFLRLNKEPFRFQHQFHPLKADDLDVLQAHELLVSRAGLLATLVELALPADQRRDRFRCFANLKLLKSGSQGPSHWMLFQVPPESRQAELTVGEPGLILTNDDPDIRLNYQRWREFAVDLVREKDGHGATILASVKTSIFNSPAFQELMRKDSSWFIDKTFLDFNSPRVLALLRFLAAAGSKG